MSSKLMVMVGPPGSGKSTFAKKYEEKGFIYINQDSQGREEHLKLFELAISTGKDVIVDRMGFSKQQRSRYINLAKAKGYETAITVLHESYSTCLERCLKRTNHETIRDGKDATNALNFFFSKYERVEDNEADTVQRFWPNLEKQKVIVCDLDGTLCDVEHRRHFVRKPKGEKKDWKGFFDAMINDPVNVPVFEILNKFKFDYEIVFCSGRPDNYKRETVKWLDTNYLGDYDLFMRQRNDQRQDDIVKEILLDFEILTRYEPFFILDDRDQVVAMWRKRGYTCLQVAPGDF